MPVRKKILLLLALAVLIRILAFIVFRSTFDFVLTGQIHGSHAYDTYAVNLLQTGVFGALPGIPDASIPPLYAYILAGVYSLFGRGAPQVVLLNVIVDLVSIVLLVDIGRRLFPDGQAVGLVAGLAAALYPYLIFQSLTLIDSPLFAALLTAFIWAMVVLRQRQDNSASTLALAGFGGLLLGLATLTRPVLAAFVVLLPLWFLFRRTPRETAVRLAPVALLAIVVIGVWTARNARVYERFMPMTATAGSNFWQGNSPLVVPLLRAGYDVQWTSPESLEASDPRSAEADEERFRLALDYLRQHPEDIPELMWFKFITQWSIDVAPRFNPTDSAGPLVTVPGRAEAYQVPQLAPTDPITRYSTPLFDRIGRSVHRLYWGGMLLLAIAGSVLVWRAWREVSLIWFVLLAMTVAYVVFHPATRYRAPGDPFVFLLAAYAIAWVARRTGVARTRPQGSS